MTGIRHFSLLFAVALVASTSLAALPEYREPNYDESKVAPYALEDPLVFADGSRVKTAADWERRRAEIVAMFQHEMYGRLPPKPEKLVCEVVEKGDALSGLAERTQVRMWFRADKSGPSVMWLLYVPKAPKGPCPVVEMLNYGGNQAIANEKEIIACEAPRNWPHKPGELDCSTRESTVALGQILSRGFAFLTACYAELSNDTCRGDDSTAYDRLFELWGPRDPNRDDNTSALTCWAWALMRGLDYVETNPRLDAKRVTVCGSSRLGKAAFIAAAYDTRFATAVLNQCGGGGVTLTKRNYGENITTEMRSFPHWYCRAYGKWGNRENEMPFDQHLLLACIAPRRVLIEGYNEGWFDTKGEFLACRAASPAWEFFGKKGVSASEFPDNWDESALKGDVAYVRRPGEHGFSPWDWTWLLDFSALQ